MNITFELKARQMLTHLCAALDHIDKADDNSPDEWDEEQIRPIRNALENLICEVKEEMA